jgi:transcriptional regulator with GAF, ATPase, and Fis domain
MALFGKQQQQRERIAREAITALFAGPSLHESLHRCLLVLREQIPIDAAFVGDIDREQKIERMLAQATAEAAKPLDLALPLNEPNDPDGAGFEPDALLVINRPETSSAAAEMAQFLGTEDFSLIIVPLVSSERRIGTAHFLATRRDAFSRQHAELIELIRIPLTIAVFRQAETRRKDAEQKRLWAERDWLRARLLRTDQPIIGSDGGLARVMNLIEHVATIRNPALLRGPAGSGKTRLALAIHQKSPSKAGPLIRFDCSAHQGRMIEARLFGKPPEIGAWQLAKGGSVVIERVDELPIELQKTLLAKIGEDLASVRLIATTRRDLGALVARTLYSDALYQKLKAFRIVLPPLCERTQDLSALLDHFLAQRALALGSQQIPRLTPALRDKLLAHRWPGNLHELQHVVDRILLAADEQPLTLAYLLGQSYSDEAIPNGSSQGADYAEIIIDHDAVNESLVLDDVMAAHIRRVLALSDGRVEGKGGAAELMQINPSTLRKRMRKLGILFGRKARKQGS